MFVQQNFPFTKEVRYLWDKSIIGFALVDKDGNWLKLNSTLCNILEYTETELERRNFQELTHPEDLNDDISMMKKIIAGDIDWYPMTKRYITKTGKIVWVKLTVNAVRNDDDEFICFFSQVLPIDPECHNIYTIRTATDKVRNKKFTLSNMGEYLTKNWMWISPISAGFGYCFYRVIDFVWQLILLINHQPLSH